MAKKSDRKVRVIMHVQSNAFLVIGPLLAKFFYFALILKLPNETDWMDVHVHVSFILWPSLSLLNK